jgi:hypothetical protein
VKVAGYSALALTSQNPNRYRSCAVCATKEYHMAYASIAVALWMRLMDFSVGTKDIIRNK